MSTIFRNAPSGFSALSASHPFASLDLTNPWKWSNLKDDFNAYDITQLVSGAVPYTFTQTNCVDTITSPTGILNLTLGGADNDVGQLQVTGSPFAPSATKRTFFMARFALSLAASGTIAANELFIGLAKEQTTTSFMGSTGLALTVDNCIGFVKYDAQATMATVARVSDVESTDAGLITLTDGVFVNVAFYYDGKTIRFWQGTAVDGSDMSFASPISSLQADVVGAITTCLYIKAGEAKANALKVDFYDVYQER